MAQSKKTNTKGKGKGKGKDYEVVPDFSADFMTENGATEISKIELNLLLVEHLLFTARLLLLRVKGRNMHFFHIRAFTARTLRNFSIRLIVSKNLSLKRLTNN